MFFFSDIEYLQASWKCLSVEYDKEFTYTYQILHQAVQFLAITGKSVFPPRYDDSHTAFRWDYSSHCFAGEWIHAQRTHRLELCPQTLKMCLVPYGGKCTESFSLVNKTKKEVYASLRNLLNSGGIKVDHFTTNMHYDLPVHEVCSGGRYRINDPKLHEELATHYSNAFLVLHLLNGKSPRTTGIRCWPHHFDLTINISPRQKNMQGTTELTIGFSPANPDMNTPHYFVEAHNRQNSLVTKGKLKFGQWFSGQKIGTYLPINQLVKKKSAEMQVGLLAGYLKESIDIFR